MHDEKENKTSLLKYEVCVLLMVCIDSNGSVIIQERLQNYRFSLRTILVNLIWFN